MKRLTYLLIFVASFGYSQNNLVFNKVLNFKLATNQTATVPADKAWKIEGNPGIEFTSPNPEYGMTPSNGVYFNSEDVVWLAEGTTITGSTAPSLSILEFDVVPISTTGGGTGGTGGTGTGSGGGQSYGDDFTEGPQLTDNDGNVYETVQLGDQIWTTSNLNVSTYSDGTPIPHITDKNEWLNAQIGAYTYFRQADGLGYGKIYNTYAILGRHDTDNSTPYKKLAPEGYHIPNQYEWDQLFNFYGGVESAGIYLKSETEWAWQGNNQSGLNVKPYGWIGPSESSTSTNIGFLPASNLFSNITMLATSNYRHTSYTTLTTVVFTDDTIYTLHGQAEQLPSFVGYSYLNHWPYQDRVNGAYVRLIKD